VYSPDKQPIGRHMFSKINLYISLCYSRKQRKLPLMVLKDKIINGVTDGCMKKNFGIVKLVELRMQVRLLSRFDENQGPDFYGFYGYRFISNTNGL